MTIVDILFFLFAGVILFGLLFMLRTQKLIHAAFALFFILFAQAGMFVFAGAEFIAISQIIIYVGGVLILVLFGVLLTVNETPDAEAPTTGLVQQWPAGLVALAIIGGLLYAFPPSVFEQVAVAAQPSGMQGVGPAEAIGFQLLTDWILPFELAGVFLLIVLVGAAFLARAHSGAAPSKPEMDTDTLQ